MFPTTAPVLDPLLAPLGTMTGNGSWLSNAAFGDADMTIVAGGARGTSNGVSCGAQWGQRLAGAQGGFVTMAALPTSPQFVAVGALSDPAGDLQIAVAFDTSPLQLQILTNLGSSTFALGAASAGDAIGWSYDPGSDTATAWYRAAGTTTWVSKGTKGGGLAQAPGGWLAYVETSDANTVLLRDFGALLLPGALQQAAVTSPLVHGRGAC